MQIPVKAAARDISGNICYTRKCTNFTSVNRMKALKSQCPRGVIVHMSVRPTPFDRSPGAGLFMALKGCMSVKATSRNSVQEHAEPIAAS